MVQPLPNWYPPTWVLVEVPRIFSSATHWPFTYIPWWDLGSPLPHAGQRSWQDMVLSILSGAYLGRASALIQTTKLFPLPWNFFDEWAYHAWSWSSLYISLHSHRLPTEVLLTPVIVIVDGIQQLAYQNWMSWLPNKPCVQVPIGDDMGFQTLYGMETC